MLKRDISSPFEINKFMPFEKNVLQQNQNMLNMQSQCQTQEMNNFSNVSSQSIKSIKSIFDTTSEDETYIQQRNVFDELKISFLRDSRMMFDQSKKKLQFQNSIQQLPEYAYHFKDEEKKHFTKKKEHSQQFTKAFTQQYQQQSSEQEFTQVYEEEESQNDIIIQVPHCEISRQKQPLDGSFISTMQSHQQIQQRKQDLNKIQEENNTLLIALGCLQNFQQKIKEFSGLHELLQCQSKKNIYEIDRNEIYPLQTKLTKSLQVIMSSNEQLNELNAIIEKEESTFNNCIQEIGSIMKGQSYSSLFSTYCQHENEQLQSSQQTNCYNESAVVANLQQMIQNNFENILTYQQKMHKLLKLESNSQERLEENIERTCEECGIFTEVILEDIQEIMNNMFRLHVGIIANCQSAKKESRSYQEKNANTVQVINAILEIRIIKSAINKQTKQLVQLLSFEKMNNDMKGSSFDPAFVQQLESMFISISHILEAMQKNLSALGQKNDLINQTNFMNLPFKVEVHEKIQQNAKIISKYRLKLQKIQCLLFAIIFKICNQQNPQQEKQLTEELFQKLQISEINPLLIKQSAQIQQAIVSHQIAVSEILRLLNMQNGYLSQEAYHFETHVNTVQAVEQYFIALLQQSSSNSQSKSSQKVSNYRLFIQQQIENIIYCDFLSSNEQKLIKKQTELKFKQYINSLQRLQQATSDSQYLSNQIKVNKDAFKTFLNHQEQYMKSLLVQNGPIQYDFDADLFLPLQMTQQIKNNENNEDMVFLSNCLGFLYSTTIRLSNGQFETLLLHDQQKDTSTTCLQKLQNLFSSVQDIFSLLDISNLTSHTQQSSIFQFALLFNEYFIKTRCIFRAWQKMKPEQLAKVGFIQQLDEITGDKQKFKCFYNMSMKINDIVSHFFAY